MLDAQRPALIAEQKQAFLDAMAQINASLRYTAANAPAGSHSPLAERREALFGRHEVLAAPAGAPDRLHEVVALAKAISGDAARLAETAQTYKRWWEEPASTLHATGLDPAFAPLFNPTDGMVGPGMDVLAPTDANSPVILHGIFHDAGGCLSNYQNSGPGYTYLPHMRPRERSQRDRSVAGADRGGQLLVRAPRP